MHTLHDSIYYFLLRHFRVLVNYLKNKSLLQKYLQLIFIEFESNFSRRLSREKTYFSKSIKEIETFSTNTIDILEFDLKNIGKIASVLQQ